MNEKQESMNSTRININKWTPVPAVLCAGSEPVLVFLYVICTIPSVLINSIILWVLFKKINAEIKQRYIFVKCLTVADLLTAAISQPLSLTVVMQLHNLNSNEALLRVHRIVFFLTSITCTASVSSICCLCIQRYIYITYPFTHESILTQKKLTNTVIFIWIIAVGGSFIPWIQSINGIVYYIYILVALSVEVIVIGTVYSQMVKVVKNLIVPVGLEVNQENSRRVITTSVMSLTVFIVLWFPFAISGLLYFSNFPSKAWENSDGIEQCTAAIKMHATVIIYSIFMAQLSSLLNPIVYTSRDICISSAVRDLVFKILMERASLENPATTTNNAAMQGKNKLQTNQNEYITKTAETQA